MAFSAPYDYLEKFLEVKRWQLFFVAVFITALATSILYAPVSIAVYKIKEPYFRCPIRVEPRKFAIRNDSRGDGDFGAKRRNGRSHTGIDILAPVGTPVYAAKSGVAFCGNIPTGYGIYIMIYHPDGFQTIYGHLSGCNVISTQHVYQGELIGFVGKTGNAANKSIQPHLHFEIKKEGEPQDPRALMK